MIPVYALLSRIRLSSSEPVLQTAEQIIKTIVNTYPQPNLTADQIQFRALNGQDPLREFSDTCRAELDWLQATSVDSRRFYSSGLRILLRRHGRQNEPDASILSART